MNSYDPVFELVAKVLIATLIMVAIVTPIHARLKHLRYINKIRNNRQRNER